MPEISEEVKTNGATPPSQRWHIPLKEAPPAVQKRVALAQWFAKVGFGVICINPGTKGPSDKRWNKEVIFIFYSARPLLSRVSVVGLFPDRWVSGDRSQSSRAVAS